MIRQPSNRRVVFILSLGHSGSTLLGHCLGAHPSILHLGEVPAVFDKGLPFRCHFCMDRPCPVWGAALDEKLVRSSYQTFTEHLTKPKINWRTIFNRKAQTLPGLIYQRLFESFPEKQVIVDGSKNPGWSQWHSQNGSFRSVFLLLVRDLRAVIGSYLRREPIMASKMAQRMVDNFSHSLDYFQQQPEEDRILIRYEELVLHPAEELRRLTAFLHLPFSSSMLEFWKTPQHTIGGNRAPNLLVRTYHGKDNADYMTPLHPADREHYQDRAPGFHLDDRWKTELSPRQLAEINDIAGPLNHDLGYQ